MEIKRFSKRYLNHVWHLYIEAFPPAERRDFVDAEDFLHFFEEHADIFSILVLEENDEFAGFVTLWRFAPYNYVEHLAIEPRFRNQGLGAQVLEALKKESAHNGLILEVEKPVDEMAKRRIGFYNRCGFDVCTEVDYIQPPYSPRLKPVPMLIMTWGNAKVRSYDDLKPLLENVYGVKN